MRTVLMLAMLVLPVSVAATTAAADTREMFHGTWGTAQQCARTPLKPGGTVLAAPFEIGPAGLKQGKLWCSLNWGPVEVRAGETFTLAQAQCGEDSVRGYLLGMVRTGETLTLRWNAFHAAGPLKRCPAP